ncbi:peptide chain release factor N(5)-glutamine methyltransferase [uncultured Tessaracoccus sp.]|uniref:peptide chain release factor N(5)-glutamine methyltransferase n=1 Tax=uncultured Tessaracoccus sp. TaxID=905023 RepID=UPI002631285C|nr:peptide chain release factor N(5)-glutamine methyltransferase [uncultured Tessaracoccus sp.]
MRPTELIFELADEFASFGFPSPSSDARLLVAEACETDVSQLLTRWEVTPGEQQRARALARRRVEGEPVQHITGEAFFRYETLHVGPGVFIPRPETELVAGKAIELLAARPPDRRRVVELCAGSGAIIRSIVRELGGVEAFANERSTDAEPWLRRNLSDVDVTVDIGCMSTAFPKLDATVDLVVVNPPYVPERVRDWLPKDVVGRDPHAALFAGPDGLDAMPVVATTAARLLRPGGTLVVEHDESHQAQVIQIFRRAGFAAAEGYRDLTGRDRFVTAEWVESIAERKWQDSTRE